tara:strand:+ start:384 stop:545 length:162 start_codon:yes stop_codon:yes gene_type:complete
MKNNKIEELIDTMRKFTDELTNCQRLSLRNEELDRELKKTEKLIEELNKKKGE